jgi:hypothetical protein
LDEDGDIIEFHTISKTTFEEMQMVLHRICERLGRLLEERGLLCRDVEQSYLTFDYDDEDLINDLIGSSITYRVAVGKNKGKKGYTLQTIPAQLEEMAENKALAKESGFSLHAGVSAKSYHKEKFFVSFWGSQGRVIALLKRANGSMLVIKARFSILQSFSV